MTFDLRPAGPMSGFANRPADGDPDAAPRLLLADMPLQGPPPTISLPPLTAPPAALPPAALPAEPPPVAGRGTPAAGVGLAVTLPLVLSGDTARPQPNVASRSDLAVELNPDGSATISHRDNRLSQTTLTRLPVEWRQTPDGLQGRMHDADGRTVGTFDGVTLHLSPEFEHGLDTVAQALTDGAGQPPRGRDHDSAGCEEAPKGEPGRTAGIDPLPARSSVPDALRADSARARALVQRVDPVLNMPLAGLKPSDWQAHHLITRDAAGSDTFKSLFDAAQAAGWCEDSAANLIGLPTNCPAQERLERLGVHRPLHNGSHPSWSQDVVGELTTATEALSRTGLAKGTVEYQQKARQLLEALQSQLRARLGGMDRVVELPTSNGLG